MLLEAMIARRCPSILLACPKPWSDVPTEKRRGSGGNRETPRKVIWHVLAAVEMRDQKRHAA